MVRSEDEDEQGGGGGIFVGFCGVQCAVCSALSPGGKSQGLFDVEIGQFESVSFNFSQVTGTPWVCHTFLIGNKWIFLIFLPFSPPQSFSLSFWSILLNAFSFCSFFFFCSWIYSHTFRGSFQSIHAASKAEFDYFSILKATGLIVRGSRSSKN